MVVEIEVISGKGGWEGSKGAISGYSYKESSTPLAANDSSGATPAFTVGISEDSGIDGTFALLDSKVRLTDDLAGGTEGIVRAVTSKNGTAGLEIESILSVLNADVNVGPYNGNLSGAITFYMNIAGIPSNAYFVDPAIATMAVTLPGWYGPIWDNLKSLCVARQIEVAAVNSQIVIRPIRTVTGNHDHDTDASASIDSQQAAKTVEVYYYNNTYKSIGLMYPPTGTEASTFQVGAGEVSETSVAINAYIMNIAQPQPLASISSVLTNLSAYVVVDKDGKIVSPNDWLGGGGKVTAKAGAAPNEMIITVQGAAIDGRAPFRLGMPEQPNNKDNNDIFPSLRIAGEGVFFDKKLFTIPTGANPALAIDQVGETIDNPFISTQAEAAVAGVLAAKNWSGRNKSISGSATSLADIGLDGAVTYYTYNQFQADNPGKTYNAFQVEWAGKTYNEFAAAMRAKAADKKLVQAFGNIAGARIPHRNSMYRIRDVTYTEDGLQYTAESDTLANDFQTRFAGVTYAQFQAMMAGRTYNDFALDPLYRPGYWADGAVVARNYFPNPRAVSVNSFGAGTLGSRSLLTDMPGNTPTAIRWTRTGTAAARVLDWVVGSTFPTNTTITVSGKVRSNFAGAILVFSARPTASSTGNQVTLANVTISEADVFQNFSVTGPSFTVAAGSNSGIVPVNSVSPVGTTFDFTEIMIEVSSSPSPFFDGSTPNTNDGFSYYWDGTPDASASRKVQRVFNP